VIIKEFTNLPEHAAVMVEGQVLINTAFPSKKVVYVKVNNKIVWLEHFDFEGNENCETTWEKIPISFTIQHKESSLLLEIGMKSSSVDNNKCEGILNDNSNKIGLDDFILYVK